MGHIVLESPGPVASNAPFDVTVRIEQGQQGVKKLTLKQENPPSGMTWFASVVVDSNGAGFGHFLGVNFSPAPPPPPPLLVLYRAIDPDGSIDTDTIWVSAL